MTLNTLGTPKPGNYDPTLVDRLNKAAAEDARRDAAKAKHKPAEPAPQDSSNAPPTIPRTDFSLEEVADCYRFTGVPHGTGAYDLSKTLLDLKTQDDHAEHAKNAKPLDFRACNAPLVYAICKALYDNRYDKTHKVVVEKARQDLREFFANTWLFALSRVEYNPEGQPDSIVHDYNLSTHSKEDVELVGPDGFITDSKSNALVYSQKLLGTKDSVEQINTVLKWISGKKAYAYRLNDKPENRGERVVALGVGSDDWFSLDASGDFISSDGSALGVRPSQKISTGNQGGK